jgi:hypothetical protein
MNSLVRKYLAEIGKKGGRKSRRLLTPQAAKKMVRIREAKRAFRNFHTQCFWSYDPHYPVGEKDIAWIVHELKKNGGREGFHLGEKLCH